MGVRPLEIFKFFQRGDRLHTSESDVYRRQILTYKDDPCTERVNSDYMFTRVPVNPSSADHNYGRF